MRASIESRSRTITAAEVGLRMYQGFPRVCLRRFSLFCFSRIFCISLASKSVGACVTTKSADDLPRVSERCDSPELSEDAPELDRLRAGSVFDRARSELLLTERVGESGSALARTRGGRALLAFGLGFGMRDGRGNAASRAMYV